jgi:hypothetical protein
MCEVGRRDEELAMAFTLPFGREPQTAFDGDIDVKRT